MRRRGLTAVLLAAGCGVTPLSNKIAVGDEAFVVVVGEGAGGITDLYAAPAEGGTFYQLTFTRTAEDLPRLDPSGTKLLFVRRGAPPGDDVVLMDLKAGTEVTAPVPLGSGTLARLGWSATGDTMIAITDRGVWASAVARPVWVAAASARAASLDSLTREQIGDPRFAVVATCRSGVGLCIVTDEGEETALASGATQAIRWGGEAVAYVLGNDIEVRPLGGGRLRHPSWKARPAAIRQPTHHPGSGGR